MPARNGGNVLKRKMCMYQWLPPFSGSVDIKHSVREQEVQGL